jgi:hypothetical protein
MERRSNRAGGAMLASVVRQFTPSRIEQQLLGQVFESVMTLRRHSQPSAFDSVDDRESDEARRLNETSRGQERSAA